MIKLTTLLKKSILREDDDFDLSDNPLVPQKGRALERVFLRNNPIVTLQVGRKKVSGHGKIYDYGQLPTPRTFVQEESQYWDDSYTSYEERMYERFLWAVDSKKPRGNNIADFFNITWTKVALFKRFRLYDDNSGNFHFNYEGAALKGVNDEGIEFILTMEYKGADVSLITATGKVSLLSMPTDLTDASPARLQNLKQKLFPDKNAKQDKVPNVRTFTQAPDAKIVKMRFGNRIRREGPGIEGSYEDLKKYLTFTSQENLTAAAKRWNITWKNMIIYDEGGDTLFSVLGTDRGGQYYMWDRAGHGQGSYSKLRGPLLRTEL